LVEGLHPVAHESLRDRLAILRVLSLSSMYFPHLAVFSRISAAGTRPRGGRRGSRDRASEEVPRRIPPGGGGREGVPVSGRARLSPDACRAAVGRSKTEIPQGD